MKFLTQFFFRMTMLPVVQLLYRVRRTGTGFVPRDGGVLLLANHVSYIDAFVMYLCSPRPVRFVVLESYSKVKSIGWFMKLFEAIPIRPTHAKEALGRTVEALKNGDVVCLFPEGGLTRLGVTGEFKKGFEVIARRAGCPVVPVYMDGLWNSIFSFERGKYFHKRPLGWTCPLQVAFGRPIPPEEATAERMRLAVWEQSVEAFSIRRDFDRPLEVALVKALKKNRRQPLFVECGKNATREWSRGDVLGLATTIARRWMNSPPEDDDRVGIILPSGPMTTAINLGLFLAGKSPVNLPFTIDQHETETVAKSIAPLGIRTVITSQAFMPHLVDFWQGDEGSFIDMKSVVAGSGPGLTLFEKWRAFCEPAWLTCWRLGLNQRAPEREAFGIVSSPGTVPVVLTSSELHRNAVQVTAANFVSRDEVIFTEESLACASGLMLGCWAPLLARGRVLSRSFSLRNDFESLNHLLLRESAGVIAGNGRFFGGIGSPLIIRSLKYGILFGPTTAQEIEDWEEKLDLPLARAWEAHGRVVSMSRTDPDTSDLPDHAFQRGRLAKSLGRPLPGVAARVRDGELQFRFDPVGESDSPGNWLPGPRQAEIDPNGFLFANDVGASGSAP